MKSSEKEVVKLLTEQLGRSKGGKPNETINKEAKCRTSISWCRCC
jgi:hypothetical protein